MKTYVQSVYYQSWLILQDGPFLILGDWEGMKYVDDTSTEYTREQEDVIQANARGHHILSCALSMEEFENISSCETAKESWDKLEIIHEGTQKLKDVKMDLLVHEFVLFEMKEDETIKNMFRRFNKILGDLKALGKSNSNGHSINNIYSI